MSKQLSEAHSSELAMLVRFNGVFWSRSSWPWHSRRRVVEFCKKYRSHFSHKSWFYITFLPPLSFSFRYHILLWKKVHVVKATNRLISFNRRSTILYSKPIELSCKRPTSVTNLKAKVLRNTFLFQSQGFYLSPIQPLIYWYTCTLKSLRHMHIMWILIVTLKLIQTYLVQLFLTLIYLQLFVGQRITAIAKWRAIGVSSV